MNTNYFCVFEMEQPPSNCSYQCYQHNLSVDSLIRYTLFPGIPIEFPQSSFLSWVNGHSELSPEAYDSAFLNTLKLSLPFSEKSAHKLLSVYLYMKISVGCQESMEGKHNSIPEYIGMDLDIF